MRLGNSGGANKGKKYFVKNRDLQNTEVLFEREASEFALWFSDNHKKIKRQIVSKSNYNEDAFNETYLRLHEIILYTGRKIENYMSYFCRSYFTNNIQLKMQENRYVEMFENIESKESEPIDDVDSILDSEEITQKRYNDVLSFVQEKYSIEHSNIFKLNMVEGLSYTSISKALSIKSHTIQRIVSRIKQDLKQRLEHNNQTLKSTIMEENMKRCRKCNLEKPTKEFNKNFARPDGLQIHCRECQRIANEKRKNKGVGGKERVGKINFNLPNNKAISLETFSPEELMKELYRRGYEGVLSYTTTINISQA